MSRKEFPGVAAVLASFLIDSRGGCPQTGFPFVGSCHSPDGFPGDLEDRNRFRPFPGAGDLDACPGAVTAGKYRDESCSVAGLRKGNRKNKDRGDREHMA